MFCVAVYFAFDAVSIFKKFYSVIGEKADCYSIEDMLQIHGFQQKLRARLGNR